MAGSSTHYKKYPNDEKYKMNRMMENKCSNTKPNSGIKQENDLNYKAQFGRT